MILIGGAITLWGFWPVPTGHQELVLLSSDFQPNRQKLGSDQGLANPPAANLSLDWPAEIWIGEQKEIQLSLRPSTSSKSIDYNANASGPVSYHLVAESRLEIGPLSPQSGDSLQQPWNGEKPLLFYWTVQPAQTGIYEGSIWFYLNFVTADGKIAQRMPVSDQTVRIQVRDLYGVTPGLARKAGIAITLGGLLLVISLAFARKPEQKTPVHG